MNGFVLAFALLATKAFAFAEPPPEIRRFREECKNEIGSITEGEPPRKDVSKAKCFHACMMRKMERLVDGKLNLEKELELASRVIPDMDNFKRAKMADCINKANAESDECEVGPTFAKCLKDDNVLPTSHSRPPVH